jgi:hypothetical protein
VKEHVLAANAVLRYFGAKFFLSGERELSLALEELDFDDVFLIC